MAGKTAFYEKALLQAVLLQPQATIQGGNASTTNILVNSSTNVVIGHVVKYSGDSTCRRVTAIPDGTHITVDVAISGPPTSGTLTVVGYAPPAIYVGLFTALPSDAGGGTEASGGNYARQQVTQAPTNWAAPSGTPSSTSNSNVIAWSAVTWSGTVVAWGLFDALSGGNLLMWFDCADQAVAATNTVQFAAGQLSVSED
jgi:hypothetical protein